MPRRPSLTIVPTCAPNELRVQSPPGVRVPNLRRVLEDDWVMGRVVFADGCVRACVAQGCWGKVARQLRKSFVVDDPACILRDAAGPRGRPAKDRSNYVELPVKTMVDTANRVLREQCGACLQCRSTGKQVLLTSLSWNGTDLHPVGVAECSNGMVMFSSFAELRDAIRDGVKLEPQRPRYAGWRSYDILTVDGWKAWYKLGTECIEKKAYKDLVTRGSASLPADVAPFGSLPMSPRPRMWGALGTWA